MKKHIVIIAHFAGSSRHGMVYGHYHLAQEWVKQGHRVTVLSASYSHLRFEQPEVKGQVTVEDIEGIEYRWLRVPEARGDQHVKRAASIVAFSAMAWWDVANLDPADVVICSSHHPLAIVAAERCAQRHGAELVFEVRDLWPLTLIEVGNVSPKHPFIQLLQWAEDRAYRVADRVVSVLPRAHEYMVTRGMDWRKFEYVPNGIAELGGGRECWPNSLKGTSIKSQRCLPTR